MMELGGNIPDSLIEHLLIGGASVASAIHEEPTVNVQSRFREQDKVKDEVPTESLREEVAEDEEEEEPLTVGNR